jgi:hypothetical protein
MKKIIKLFYPSDISFSFVITSINSLTLILPTYLRNGSVSTPLIFYGIAMFCFSMAGYYHIKDLINQNKEDEDV